MCFVLYLGARIAPPIIPHSGTFKDGKVYTRPLNDDEIPVREHFTLPHVVYVGSDLGCGCGFRNTTDVGDWADELAVSMPEFDPGEKQANQEALVAFLRQHFGAEPCVELYGQWYGNFALPEQERREITPADITSPHFHFHSHGLCRVMLAEN